MALSRECSAQSSHLADLARDIAVGARQGFKATQFLGLSSGIALARLVMSAVKVESLPVQHDVAQGPSMNGPESKASLPPRTAADHLVEVYFQYRTPHLPLIDRQGVTEALDCTYSWTLGVQSSERTIPRHVFTSFMVLAIALCDLPNPNDPLSLDRPAQSQGCFLSALLWMEDAIVQLPSEIETLRSVLLLAQFIALNPSRGSLWHLTGIALRLCVELGFHWEADDQATSSDQDSVQDRRRLWYSTYYFDRILCNTLGRPFGIADDDVRVPLPNPWAWTTQLLTLAPDFDVQNQRAHNHMFRLSLLESEIRQAQQNQRCSSGLSQPKVNYAHWMRDIQPRLKEWYDTLPATNKFHSASVFALEAYWDSIYNYALILLHQPGIAFFQEGSKSTRIAFEASTKFVANIKALQREGRCECLWKTAHQLFMAGLGVIYGLWQSQELRDKQTPSISIDTLQSCASTLAAMSATFPAAAGCRDVFDVLSSKTIAHLVATDLEKSQQRRADFDHQLGSLLQGLECSEANTECSLDDHNLSCMTAVKRSNFGEMLTSAAQKTPYQPNFFDMGFTSMVGPGNRRDLS
ncbi:Zn(2)-C6 fungal-type DNA-binding domain [Teratosphaeria destructans]|uniref:Zn(2)-C6 fungal-type DNA-binding domain n=1 Tax=Teratosphaeria destructans TaxID=418781 RepID=A0A9W7SNU5_9PEZI|nr:Zn(2)-C6 fungal-type DNA-binding domain [Teratosphaeria destructans]